jgi:glucose/arabinose dehydrogenase
VAGGRKGARGDGKDARKAGLNRPHGVAIDENGVLYIADSENYRVRRVQP